MEVPKGHSKIAQRFIAGLPPQTKKVPAEGQKKYFLIRIRMVIQVVFCLYG